MTKSELDALRERLADVHKFGYRRYEDLSPDNARESYIAGWDAVMELVTKWVPIEEGLHEFVNAILENAPSDWDGDESAMAIAFDYVRHLQMSVI